MSGDREPDERGYRFGPLERRGLVGGLSLGQVLSLAGGCVGGVVTLRLLPTGGGFVLSLCLIGIGVALAFAPAQGRTPVAWAPVVLEWLRSQHTHRSRAPLAGVEGAL